MAAKVLAVHDPPFYLGKVDATKNKDLAKQFKIEGFPTLILFA